MIIDMRCRLTTPEASVYYKKWLDMRPPAVRSREPGSRRKSPLEGGTEEAFFKEIAALGITTAVSASGNNPGMRIGRWNLPARETSNDLMANVQRQHWGRFVGVAGIDAGNVFHNAVAEIERCHGLGLRAVHLEPGRSPGCNFDDPKLDPIYRKCAELRMTVIAETSGPLGGKSIDYANPVHLERVADMFPDLRIVSAHGCYPYVREAIVLATRYENVYMSPDALLLHLGTEDWLRAVNDDLHEFSDKFLFGTAYPLVDLKAYMERFFALPWEPSLLPKVLYKNALRALALEDDPTFRQMYGGAGQQQSEPVRI